jgi:hypothetical protein
MDMPLPGGPSDKAGNRYERLWAALVLTEVLHGQCERVRFEVPGPAGGGFEFRATRGKVVEWHQVKRQRAGGEWTVAALAAEKVLGPWWAKLRDGQRCVFVSGTGARELKELSERVGQAASWPEFEAQFLTGESRTAFRRLRSEWGDPPEADVYAVLPQVDVHLIDEDHLRGRVIERLSSLVSGDSETALAVLEQLVDDSVHQELTDAEVWGRLADRGHARRDLAGDATVARRVSDTVAAFRARHRGLLIGGHDLPRVETSEVFGRLGRGERVMLAGGAGYGKSVVAMQVIDGAQAAGWPVLALSADSGVASAATARAWGESLGLPDSPVTVLAGLAAGGTGLLVVDQLDAVGSVSGRYQDRRDLLEEILRQADSHPGIRVLMACRRFDLDNDRVLRRLSEQVGTLAVDVEVLDPTAVAGALTRVGVDAAVLPAPVARLLRVPLHLALYVELVASGADIWGVSTLTDLYRRYCAQKRRACRDARGGADDWPGVVDILLDRMSGTQQLTAPLAVLSELHHQQEVMMSEGVLIPEGLSQIRFSHETLFDYLWAERFVARGDTLGNLLGSDQQDLFRRAQVRQILTYERGSDPARYLADLRWLLTSPEVRLHLKILAIDLLQVTPDPTSQEWQTLRPIAEDRTHPLHHRLWLSIRRNPAWFPMIDTDNRWAAWLADPDLYMVNGAVWALSGMAAAWPDRVAALIRGLPRGAQGDGFTRMFLQLAEIHRHRVLVDLLGEAIRSGLLDGDGATDVWHTAQDVATARPEWAVDILHELLTRMITITPSDAGGDALGLFRPSGPWAVQHGYGGEEAISLSAQGAPAAFVSQLLPSALELVTSRARPLTNGSTLSVDMVWGGRHFAEPLGLLDHLLTGLAAAIAAVAEADPDYAADVLDGLRATRLESAWVLAAHGYAGNPGRFADIAGRWLTEASDALDLGYADADHRVTRRLISAISPHCSPAVHDRLVQALLDYTPPRERIYAALKRRGYGQLCLLNGIDQTRLTASAARRLAELRRKFGRDDVPTPARIRFSWITPPIPQDRAAKMSDDHWLRAVSRYTNRDLGPLRDRWSEGDASRLALVLEELTKTDPQRYARLLLRFPTGTSKAYVTAVLSGVAGAGLDGDLILDLIRRARELAGTDANRSVAWLIQSKAAGSLPTEVLDILTDIACTDPDPADDSSWREHPYSDLEIAGLNSTRGAAADAVAALLRQDPTRIDRLLPALEVLAADRTLQVRVMVSPAIVEILRTDPDTAMRLLDVCVDVPDDRLLSMPSVQTLLQGVIQAGHYPHIADLVGGTTTSDFPATRRAGARLLTVASYHQPDLDCLVNEILGGPDAEGRIGVVEVAAASARGTLRPDRSLAILTAAFNDPSEEVRAAAAQCFQGMHSQQFDEQVRLLAAAFADRLAFADHSGDLIFELGQTTHPLPEWALDSCERYLSRGGSEVTDISTRAGGHGYHLVKITFGIYAQYSSGSTRQRCLDLMDTLLAAGVHYADEAFATSDR